MNGLMRRAGETEMPLMTNERRERAKRELWERLWDALRIEGARGAGGQRAEHGVEPEDAIEVLEAMLDGLRLDYKRPAARAHQSYR